MRGPAPVAGSRAGDRSERQTGAPQRTGSERSGGSRPTQRGPQAADACYGCGAAVQAELPAAAGYVPADRAEAKRAHRQLGQLLCRRGGAQEAA
jgi:imidazolonepropionase-like amidohydrolase